MTEISFDFTVTTDNQINNINSGCYPFSTSGFLINKTSNPKTVRES